MLQRALSLPIMYCRLSAFYIIGFCVEVKLKIDSIAIKYNDYIGQEIANVSPFFLVTVAAAETVPTSFFSNST